MKFTFRIQYHTVWGEDIRIILQDNETCAIPLSTRDGSNWEGSCNYPPAEDKDTILLPKTRILSFTVTESSGMMCASERNWVSFRIRFI